MFSKTFNTGMRLNDWKIKLTVTRRYLVSARSDMPLMSRPLTITRPLVGVSMHPIMLRIVLLPEPDGPATVINSPLSTVREIPLSASTLV